MDSNNKNSSSNETPAAPAARISQGPTIVALPPVPSQQQASKNSAVTIAHNMIPPDTSNDAALAAALAAEEENQDQQPQQQQQQQDLPHNPNYRVATASFPWQYDDEHPECYGCGEHFHLLNRRHHCRLCGHVFCHHCSEQKALLPPSRIVLSPIYGKKGRRPDHTDTVSFTPDDDPDRMLTYYHTAAPSNITTTDTSIASDNHDIINNNQQQQQQLLYGKGLEERFQLAREPQRVCRSCYAVGQPWQEELRRHNSHAMRYNVIDPTDPRRLFNSPLAFTLGHEIRKAAYTLHNLLPQPKRRRGALMDTGTGTADVFQSYPYNNNYHSNNNVWQSELQQCQQNCSNVSPNGSDLDGVRIPARLLEQAKGVAVLTTVKGGFGLAGAEFGTGLVVARLSSNDPSNTTNSSSRSQRWSAPSAIQSIGLAWGAMFGAQCTDHVFLLMTDAAVSSLFQPHASVQLGADVAVAVGPLGRTLEGDWHVSGSGNNNMANAAAPSIYTYSLSKGLYAGVSLDGKVVTTRHDLNEKFYGRAVTPLDILREPAPPAAQPLYEALQRCHVYATNNNNNNSNAAAATTRSRSRVVPESSTILSEYGEIGANRRDAPSVANMSDITDF